MSSNATASTLPAEASSPVASSPPSPSSPPSAPSPSPPATAAAAAPSPSSNAASAIPPAASSPPPPATSSVAREPASSAPPPAPSSAEPAPASSPPASSQPAPSPSAVPNTTSVVTASASPPTTDVSTILITSTPTGPGEKPTVVVITSTVAATPTADSTTGAASATGHPSSTSSPTQLQNAQKDSAGLSTGGKTAIAVVIPVVAVALLVLAGLFLWRKRKARKSAEDERRKEVEEYGFNPNHDPTLPAVGGLAMAEDDSGYRGWGNTTTSSNRKASTTLTSGMAYSDSASNPGGYNHPTAGSPTHGTYSDAHSNDPLVNGRRETLDADAMGPAAAIAAGASNTAYNDTGVHRGTSNASSSYSAANQSDNSGEYSGMHPGNNPQEYYNEQGYYQTGPYGNADAYAGGAYQQPIIRDVSARRNTRIENPSVFPQQGNSGIAQNF